MRAGILQCVFAVALVLGWHSVAFADASDDQFAVAAGHYSAHRWQLAAEEFQRYLDQDPRPAKEVKATYFLGEALLQLGKFDEAQSGFAAVLKADPKGRYARQSLFRAGECAFLAGKAEDAKSSLASFRDQYHDDPLNAYALNYLGELSLREDDAASAKTSFAEAVERFGDTSTTDDSRLGLAQACLRLHEHTQAERVLDELLKTKRMTVEANYWLGQVYKADEQWQRAADVFQAAMAADPAHSGVPTLRYEAAESLVRAREFQAAIDVLRSDASQDVRALPPAHGYLVALAQQGLGKQQEALATLDSLSVDPGTDLARDVLLAKAASLVALDRHADAIEPLNEYLAAALDEDLVRKSGALAQLALAYAREKAFSEADAMLKRLIATAPHSDLSGATTLQLSRIARAAKENTLAATWLESLESDQTPPAIAAEALVSLAEISAEDGELEKSAGIYERLLDHYPDQTAAVPAALACARVRERLGQNDAALAMYNLIIDKYGDAEQLPQALLRAANLYDQLSQEPKAIELYTRVARQFESSPYAAAAIYGWAWCLRDLKRDTQANEKFEEIRRSYPSSEYWADATYRLALVAAQAKQFEQSLQLLGELISAAEKRPPQQPDSQPSTGGQTAVSGEGAGGQPPGPAANDTTAKVTPEALQFALYLRAQISIGQERWDSAERDLNRLVHEHGTSRVALVAEFLLADVSYRRGEYQTASERFAALAPKAQGRHDAWIAMIPLRRAQILAQEKRWSDARAMALPIAEVFREFDQQYEVDYLIGRTYAAEANLDEARHSYQKVLQSASGAKTETAAMAQWMIGETYFLQEQFDTAVREYLRVEVLYSYPRWQSAALLQAGKCYEQLGKWKDAGDAYGRLLQLHAKSEFAPEARERLQNVQARTAARTRK